MSFCRYAVSQVFGKPVNATPALPDNNYSIYLSDIYTKPWCRIGAYIIGMMTGYFLHTTKCQFKMNKVRNSFAGGTEDRILLNRIMTS